MNISYRFLKAVITTSLISIISGCVQGTEATSEIDNNTPVPEIIASPILKPKNDKRNL